jgi:hypothetical protein
MRYVGGMGMEGCGTFGIPVFDTTHDRVQINYFPLNDSTGVDNYATVLDCFTKQGYEKCLHLSQSWLNVTQAELLLM